MKKPHSLWRQETLHLARSGTTLAFNRLLQLVTPFVVMASILRGLRDSNRALWIVMLICWDIGLGGAILFAFGLGLGGTGIWLGIALAFVFAVALLGVRFRAMLSRPTWTP